MANNLHNRKRAFAEVVSIDAWHESFDAGHPKVDLHVDVVFEKARIGGESESPIRFRLSLRRADIVIIIPVLEPVSVDIRSVSRDSPEIEGEASVTSNKTLEFSSSFRSMSVTQSKTPEGYFRWALEPRTSQSLLGRPWNALTEPRLKLVDQRKDRSRGVPPTVRVEVWCRREDLAIEDLEIKDEGLWKTVRRKAGFKNRLAAAESYIRDRLSEEGLEVNNIEDIFGQMTFASTTAESN